MFVCIFLPPLVLARSRQCARPYRICQVVVTNYHDLGPILLQSNKYYSRVSGPHDSPAPVFVQPGGGFGASRRWSGQGAGRRSGRKLLIAFVDCRGTSGDGSASLTFAGRRLNHRNKTLSPWRISHRAASPPNMHPHGLKVILSRSRPPEGVYFISGSGLLLLSWILADFAILPTYDVIHSVLLTRRPSSRGRSTPDISATTRCRMSGLGGPDILLATRLGPASILILPVKLY